MNQYYLSGRPWMVLAVLLLLPVLALAQSPYEGIYMGSYEGTRDNGEFALIVDNLAYASLAAYDVVDDIAYLENNIPIRADGTFRFVTQRGAHIDGLVTASGLSGTWYARGTEGSFAGQRMPDDGPLEHAAGFYTGWVSITRPGESLSVNGRMVAVISADGSSFFLLDQAFPGSAGHGLGGIDLDLDLDLDFGFDFDFNFGVGSGPGTGPNFGFGACWPVGFGWNWSFGVSVFGLVDVDFNFSRPSCSAFWNWGRFPGLWHRFPAAFEHSGGLAQIDPDGLIETRFMDGLQLEGYLDPESGYAEGLVFRHQGASAWTGHWSIHRQYSTNDTFATQRFDQLPDLDGDGDADIFWRHAVTGENAVWLMEGDEIVDERSLEIPAVIRDDVLWSLVAVEELNADGMSDYVFRHAGTGQIFVSFGEHAGSTRFVLDPAMKIVGSGDFDADSLPDILLSNPTTGAEAVVSNLSGDPALTPLPDMGDHSWTSVAVADFDGDDRPDVLRMNRHTHELRVAVMSGLTPAYEIYLPVDASHKLELAGVGDFDRDGLADILRRNHETGTVIVNRRLAEGGGEALLLGADIPRGWQLAAVGDLNGDGSDDLVWRQTTTGDNVSWHLVDSQIAESVPLIPVPDLHWTIQQ